MWEGVGEGVGSGCEEEAAGACGVVKLGGYVTRAETYSQ